MAIPSYDQILYPMLKLVEDGRERIFNNVIDELAQSMKVSEEERTVRMPNQNSHRTVFAYRAAWAKTYLKMAGLISYPERGSFVITKRGKKLLADESINELNKQILSQFREFVDFTSTNSNSSKNDSQKESTQTPLEQLQEIAKNIKNTLSKELLDNIMQCSPSYFEQIVIDVLLSMGYGGSFEDAGLAIGRSNDGGVDGVIKEDILGLDKIYIQAKKVEKTCFPCGCKGFFRCSFWPECNKRDFYNNIRFF
nr:winged helix-turn-helix domain-containing protein [Seleniivibrio sp.]